MAGDWPETTWGDIAELKYGKAMTAYTDQPNVARVYGTNGPIGWHNAALQPGPGVIVGRKGAYRGVHYADQPFWVIDTAYYLKPLVPMNLRWAYYWLIDYDVNNIDDGSPIPSTTREAFGYTPVKIPPLFEQERIAELLGSLDSKVDLNRQMAATLENMARALFKSWFVDFDPVHAKAEGRDTGLAAEIAAQFPDGFNDEGLPTGWTWGTPESLVDVNPTTRIDRAGEAPYVDMAALPTQGHRIKSSISRAVSSGTRFKNGDTLLARITPCLENGKTALVDCLTEDAVGWGSTEFIVMRPLQGTPKPLPYLIARDASFRSHVIASMSGTSGRQRAPAESIGRWSMAIPTAAVIAAWGNAVTPMFDSIRSKSVEIEQLIELRNSLLPKLLSGELRVADAENVIAAA